MFLTSQASYEHADIPSPQGSIGKRYVLGGTSDYATAKFKAIPFGTYTLTARPPEKSKLAPVQEEIVLDEPLKVHTVSFKDWDRHDIEGTRRSSRDENTHTRSYHRVIRKSFWNLLPQRRDEDGQRRRVRVSGIAAGETIRFVTFPIRKNEHKYYSFEPCHRAPEDHAPFYIPQFDDETKTVFVRNDPVYTVEIALVGTVATRFTGKIIDSDKRPVPNAEIKLYRHAPYAVTQEIYPPHRQIS